jgi:autoinducer 2-degrading protein
MENQNPVHVFATWKVKEGQIENVLNLLKKVQDESVKEK